MVRLPGISDRISIVGQTGSGKTVGALWHLSMMPVDEMPFLVIDFKRQFGSGSNQYEIPFARYVNIGEPIVFPGVYIVQPRPIKEDRQAISNWLWHLLEQENVGIFVDEGFMVKDDPAFETILMQGRAKHIPVIINAQRPVWLSRFVFSESGFVQVFFLGDVRDQATLANFTPIYRNDEAGRLPKFHSWYYDVSEDRLHHFAPVPGLEEIQSTFYRKLKPVEEERKHLRLEI
jgi:hypothetical protein